MSFFNDGKCRASCCSSAGHPPGVAAQHLLEEGGGALRGVGVQLGGVELGHLDLGLGLEGVFVLEGQPAAHPAPPNTVR